MGNQGYAGQLVGQGFNQGAIATHNRGNQAIASGANAVGNAMQTYQAAEDQIEEQQLQQQINSDLLNVNAKQKALWKQAGLAADKAKDGKTILDIYSQAQQTIDSLSEDDDANDNPYMRSDFAKKKFREQRARSKELEDLEIQERIDAFDKRETAVRMNTADQHIIQAITRPDEYATALKQLTANITARDLSPADKDALLTQRTTEAGISLLNNRMAELTTANLPDHLLKIAVEGHKELADELDGLTPTIQKTHHLKADALLQKRQADRKKIMDARYDQVTLHMAKNQTVVTPEQIDKLQLDDDYKTRLYTAYNTSLKTQKKAATKAAAMTNDGSASRKILWQIQNSYEGSPRERLDLALEIQSKVTNTAIKSMLMDELDPPTLTDDYKSSLAAAKQLLQVDKVPDKPEATYKDLQYFERMMVYSRTAQKLKAIHEKYDDDPTMMTTKVKELLQPLYEAEDLRTISEGLLIRPKDDYRIPRPDVDPGPFDPKTERLQFNKKTGAYRILDIKTGTTRAVKN